MSACFHFFANKIVFFNSNNYPDLQHLHEGIKFAAQISPLLNLTYTVFSDMVLKDMMCSQLKGAEESVKMLICFLRKVKKTEISTETNQMNLSKFIY